MCTESECGWKTIFFSFRFVNDFQSDISTHDYFAIQSARHPTLAWCKVKISFLMSCYALCILQINSLILPSPFLTKTSFTAVYVKK